MIVNFINHRYYVQLFELILSDTLLISHRWCYIVIVTELTQDLELLFAHNLYLQKPLMYLYVHKGNVFALRLTVDQSKPCTQICLQKIASCINLQLLIVILKKSII